MSIKDQCAVVGIGRTKYFKRGQSWPMTVDEMAIHAIHAALDDAGLDKDDIDGFALYSAPIDPAQLGAQLGLRNLRFATTLTSGGGGAAGSVGLAAAAVHSGMATHVVSLMTLQQLNLRFGGTQVATERELPEHVQEMMRAPTAAFGSPGFTGTGAPGHAFAMITNRHMARYGTKREHFAAQCIVQRNNAIRRPTALYRDPLTMDDYFSARMISEPLCLFDYTPETDGAVAVITTSVERARDLRQPPAVIAGSAHGGTGKHFSLLSGFQMPDESFASSGHRDVAEQVYRMAGVGPGDIDVALLYDHFSPMVLMQLEDYGFCPIGESGPFVADGNTAWPGGTIPVNTHGGNLSEAYVIGFTHAYEAVEQVRGTAVNQVEGCEHALFTGGPATIPMSATIVRKA